MNYQNRIYLSVEQPILVFIGANPAGFLPSNTCWVPLYNQTAELCSRLSNLDLMMPLKLGWSGGVEVGSYPPQAERRHAVSEFH